MIPATIEDRRFKILTENDQQEEIKILEARYAEQGIRIGDGMQVGERNVSQSTGMPTGKWLLSGDAKKKALQVRN